MKVFNSNALSAIAVSLALAVSACSADSKDGEIEESERIAPIPAPEGTTWVEVATKTDMDGYMVGNPNAPIKLVEYASHSCTHCAEFSADATAKLNGEYVDSGRVSWEIRNQVHDPLDLTIAVLVRCAGPEAYHPLSEQAWTALGDFINNAQTNQAAYGKAMEQTGGARLQGVAEAAGLYDFFAARGISKDQAKQCLADEKTSEQIVQDSNTQSKEFNITGTPTFMINGKVIGTQNWKTLEPMLQKAGAR